MTSCEIRKLIQVVPSVLMEMRHASWSSIYKSPREFGARKWESEALYLVNVVAINSLGIANVIQV